MTLHSLQHLLLCVQEPLCGLMSTYIYTYIDSYVMLYYVMLCYAEVFDGSEAGDRVLLESLSDCESECVYGCVRGSEVVVVVVDAHVVHVEGGVADDVVDVSD